RLRELLELQPWLVARHAKDAGCREMYVKVMAVESVGTAVLAAWFAAGAAAQTPQQPTASLELDAVRFYRSASKQTVGDGFARVPFTLLDPLTRPDGVAAYR